MEEAEVEDNTAEEDGSAPQQPQSPHKREGFPVFRRGGRNTWMQNLLLAFPVLLFCPRPSTCTLSL